MMPLRLLRMTVAFIVLVAATPGARAETPGPAGLPLSPSARSALDFRDGLGSGAEECQNTDPGTGRQAGGPQTRPAGQAESSRAPNDRR